LPLENGWAVLGGGYQAPQYRKTFDNYIEIRGVVTGGTIAASSTVATLPAEYQPIDHRIFVTNNSDGAVRLDMMNTGVLRVLGIATNAYLSLECSFSID
jgi:hypothetical protein